jgi:hypothetical protein
MSRVGTAAAIAVTSAAIAHAGPALAAIGPLRRRWLPATAGIGNARRTPRRGPR